MPVEERSLSSGNNAESDEELEIGQPKNSEIRSGIADDVTCESEGKI